MSEFSHYSVMLSECMEGLHIRPDGIYVDCTLGGGGHSSEIVKRLDAGKLIGIDADTAAIKAAGERLYAYRDKTVFVNDNFSNFGGILDSLSIDQIDGAIIDLGVSSYQLDTPERGFSYQVKAPLDMRMDTNAALRAYDVVNTYSELSLRRLLNEYGEEPNAARIASAIVARREQAPIETTTDLVDVIKSVTPKKLLAVGHHPAKRAFQAIRIEVNHELIIIEPTIRAIIDRLKVGGRLCVISFHSLEDRLVKHALSEAARGCICPPSYPVCVCGKSPLVRVLTKKPLLPSEEELAVNHRSHSAKLRIAERL